MSRESSWARVRVKTQTEPETRRRPQAINKNFLREHDAGSKGGGREAEQRYEFVWRRA